MLHLIWQSDSRKRMQAVLIETYKGVNIYTLKAEPNALCIPVNGPLLRVGSIQHLPNLKQLIDRGDDIIENIKESVLARLAPYANGKGTLNFQHAHAVGLLQEALEARSKQDLIKVLAQQEKADKEAIEALELEKQRQQALVVAESKFKDGEYITAVEFKSLLEKYGIWAVIPLRTKGWISSSLVNISPTGAKVLTKSKSVWKCLDLLKEKMGL